MPDTPLRAYHGDPKMKANLIAKMRAHREAERLLQNCRYWTGGKGCAVGCLTETEGDAYDEFPERFGIPEQLAWLQDGIFENLAHDDAQTWPERFLSAIKPGADLSIVWPQFAIWMLTDPEHGVAATSTDEGVKAICQRVAATYQRQLDGDPLSDYEATELARAASAARDAWATRAARDARDAWAARAARASLSANKLIELLAAAPLPA